MGTVVPTREEPQGHTPEYKPTALDKKAGEDVKKYFEDSSKYWRTRHDLQKRLMARYLNTKMQDKDTGFTNIQLGRSWYICDVVDSIIGESLYEEKPYGKIAGEGTEDFPGAQDINKVNAWQQEQRYVKAVIRDSRIHSIVTGTGVKIMGWEYYIQRYRDKIEKTMKLMNPLDPDNPVEIPTGEKEIVEQEVVVDRLSSIRVDEWLTFPPAGGVNPKVDPYFMFLIKYNRKQLKELEEVGYLKNVDYIEDSAFGIDKQDTDLQDYFIKKGERKEDSQNLDKDTCWVIYYYGLYRYSEDGEVPPEGVPDEPVVIIKAKYCDTILKFDKSPYPAIPVVRDRYCGEDDEWYGRSFMEVIEKLIKLDENMYGYVQDAAMRELFKRTFVPEGMTDASVARWSPDQIVKIPDGLWQAGKMPFTETPDPHFMNNMQEQRRITSEIIDEISGVLDFVRGGDIQEEEKATMTTARVNFLTKRFKNRMRYYEDNGLQEWMEWQCVLNKMFLDDKTVEAITGTEAWLNPFKLITPILPLRSFDFKFEGSEKAADNPVMAQIYRQMLEVAKGILPGLDENGNLVQPNLMTLYRQYIRKTAPDDDIDDYFMPAVGFGMGAPSGMGAGGGAGAVTPADLLPKSGAGIRRETR